MGDEKKAPPPPPCKTCGATSYCKYNFVAHIYLCENCTTYAPAIAEYYSRDDGYAGMDIGDFMAKIREPEDGCG